MEGTTADIGPAGGELIAPPESGFAGFSIKIPAGALEETVKISFVGEVDDTPLPETAERVGPQIKVEPAGTKLAKPAELTLPLDPEMLENYEGTPDVCKVWARKGDAWERIEAMRSGLGSVTVPLSTLTTAAAGVNFTPGQFCKGSCTPLPVEETEAACESLSATYCLVKLPRPENMTFLDEFASLRVVRRKVYWAARVDGNPTVLRYDLDNPEGPAYVFPPYAGPSNGTVATRGKVAVVNENEVWASFAGYGNLRFRDGLETQAFDVPPTVQPAGVSSLNQIGTGNGVIRFTRQSAGTNTMDVRIWMNRTTESKFLFNYAKLIPGSNPTEVNPPENIISQGDASSFSLRSLHRGIGEGFDPGGGTSAAGFWGVNFRAPGSALGSVLDNDTKTFGPAAFSIGQDNVQVSSSGLQFTRYPGVGFGVDGPTTSGGFPVAVRDLAILNESELYAVSSGRQEFYVINAQNALTTTALPTGSAMSPWRIAHTFDDATQTSSMFLVTRGDIRKKGDFYLIKKK